MKLLDIAFKDLIRSYRSTIGVVFMFVVPLLVTGMFYFMFGNIAAGGDFELAAIKVVIADLDEGGPKMQAGAENVPGGIKAWAGIRTSLRPDAGSFQTRSLPAPPPAGVSSVK